jgi:hypothetical protein
VGGGYLRFQYGFFVLGLFGHVAQEDQSEDSRGELITFIITLNQKYML